MQKYYIQITETLGRVVEVEAKDHAEAIERVENTYNEGHIVLSADDFIGQADFEEIPDYMGEAEEIVKTCDICLSPEDDDGRCRCTNNN